MSFNRISSLPEKDDSGPAAQASAAPPTPPSTQSITVPMRGGKPESFGGFNMVRRVTRTGGLIGLFKTQHHNVSDQVNELNRSGYRVTFVVSDSWTFLQWLGALLLLIITIGIYTKSPGLLIIGERIS